MKYDIIIVGSGPGGYVAAIRAAQLGKKVALVERSEPGGVCLNWGCIPTKALLKSAQVYTYCKSAEHYGISLTGEVHPNLEKIVARSRGVAETMSKGVAFLLKKNNIDLIQGFGRLTAAGRLDVGGTHYDADHIILATGARPREMAFMPVDGEHVISSRQALTLTRLPETMVVVGSGAIGSEFAWFYAALGVKVTVVENTALAAQMVAQSERRDVAALSSRFCGELYGLNLLEQNVQDQDNNYTRFICISKELEIYPGADKVSLMLNVPHRPGALYGMIARFAALGLNLTKLESRPIAGTDFEFMFYFDLDASVYDEDALGLLCELDEGPEAFTYLGSYSEA